MIIENIKINEREVNAYYYWSATYNKLELMKYNLKLMN